MFKILAFIYINIVRRFLGFIINFIRWNFCITIEQKIQIKNYIEGLKIRIHTIYNIKQELSKFKWTNKYDFIDNTPDIRVMVSTLFDKKGNYKDNIVEDCDGAAIYAMFLFRLIYRKDVNIWNYIKPEMITLLLNAKKLKKAHVVFVFNDNGNKFQCYSNSIFWGLYNSKKEISEGFYDNEKAFVLNIPLTENWYKRYGVKM